MKLTCYMLSSTAVEIEPGRPDREWMDAYAARSSPYRCLPLVIANTSGWELLTPFPFKATWNGGPNNEDVTIEAPFNVPHQRVRQLVSAHFSRGTLTFTPGYLFRTEPGWDLWVGGPPNHLKHGIQAMTGIVETSWLPFPFTMNWAFTAPGAIEFAEGEPFCMIMPVRHADIDAVDPIIRSIHDNPDLKEQGIAWRDSRKAFLEKERPESAQSWQRHYFKGETSDGETGADDHINRRRLKKPRPPEAGE
jgi:hypothetical protein